MPSLRRLASGKVVAAAAILAIILAALAGCGGGSEQKRSRFAVIVMENTEFGNVIGNSDAPFLNSLARRYAIAEAYHGIRHPSLPNYLALTGGSTFGITSDCSSCSVDATSLVDQLEKAGISWKAYMESMPTPCFRGAVAGRYVKRHDPFMYYRSIADDHNRCSRIVPGSQLQRDISSDSLPDFSWISPNLCDDVHDCPLQDGDRYLAKVVPPLLQALGSRGVLFITWDEGTTNDGCCKLAHGGRVATIVVGDGAKAGTRSSVPYDHYSLLRTIEDAWKLPRMREANCSCTAAMTGLLAL
jgi:phosphatidylinositol-3-phosphatase